MSIKKTVTSHAVFHYLATLSRQERRSRHPNPILLTVYGFAVFDFGFEFVYFLSLQASNANSCKYEFKKILCVVLQ